MLCRDHKAECIKIQIFYSINQKKKKRMHYLFMNTSIVNSFDSVLTKFDKLKNNKYVNLLLKYFKLSCFLSSKEFLLKWGIKLVNLRQNS